MPKLKINWILLALSLLSLVLVRFLADKFLYEPFADFFSMSMQIPMPQYHFWPLFWSINLRFLANSAFSLLAIYSLFKRSDWVKLAFFLLLIQHFICLTAYLYFAKNAFSIGFHPSYYIRRFLLQPLMLLVLMAIFYYQQHLAKLKLSEE